MPIIQSLLDTDFYKNTMGRLVFELWPSVDVVYGFNNRTKSVQLADHIDEGKLREELDHARSLSFTNSEIHYLRRTNEYGERMFPENYLQFLRELRLPEYSLEKRNGQFTLEFPGNWSEAIYWETIALSIINELYFESFMRSLTRFGRECVYAQGRLNLMAKIEALKEKNQERAKAGLPLITFIEFGTRRRFSLDWQDEVVGILSEELPPEVFLGTSNTYLAMKYGLLPMGTSAHELFMVYARLFGESPEVIRSSHNKVLQDWWKIYGQGLSVALTDTFGSEFFFQDMTAEQARKWKGLRQDSGDPFQFGDQAIKFYNAHNINSLEKLIIFSDALDLDLIFRLAEHFTNKIRVSFGWGTNLTNDLGFKALSIVVKVIRAMGLDTVKLSDNLAKATGNEKDIALFKEAFGYTGSNYQETRY